MNAAVRALPGSFLVRLMVVSALLAMAALSGCASGAEPNTDASPPPRDASLDGGSGGGDGDVDAPLRTCASDPDCDDGDACNGLEVCVEHACATGTAVDCNDAVACTTDSCDSASGACNHAPDDAHCSAGLVCDPVDDCTAPLACAVDADCDDHVFCNGVETCEPAFGCRRGTTPACDDLLGCTVDTCDATADACAHTNDSARCDDSLACNGVEACDPANPIADGDGCVFGASPVCDDGIPCTVDGCSEAAGGCAVTTDDTVCSDGVFCNGEERCDATAGCGAGVAPTCADAIGCTNGRCDATTDACVQDPDNAFCQDGLVCNGVEHCDVTGTTPGRGCAAGAPMDCSDGLTCTTDSCAEPGTCAHGGSDADGDGFQAVGCATGADCNDLVAAIHPGAAELCDGLDNDCTGVTDDGAGMQCALGSGARVCTTACGSAGTQACNGACRLGPCVAATETCNDCDDDGNGAIDDGLACRRGTSASCSTSCGTAGSRTCAADCSGFSACVAPVETCNDCDDNGNGLVDDGLACRRGTGASCTTSCGTTGSHICSVDCSGYGTCRAATETCNGCDDDADGTIDNGFACRLGQTTACTTLCGTAGVRTCAGDCSGYGACVATEVCNGCDDNGNGTIDEGFTCAAGAARGCSTACGTTGTQACTASCGGYGSCTAAEACNNCDDDADGSIDEDFACRQGATTACTVCGNAGVRTCTATCSGFGSCTATEVCNGCDDNANGVIDDGFACASGTSRSCATACGTTGTQACNATCGGYATCSATEVCNGCDDNGNGTADDGFACRQGATNVCTTACGSPGNQTCNGTCSAVGACTGAEVCNGCDDNGVGGADETFTCVLGATTACTTACGIAGTHTCNGACSGYTAACVAAAEVCGNGCDDNGNGSIDEGCVVGPGEVTFTTVGANTFTVPAGVTQVSVVVVGGGGSGPAGSSNTGGGGGGGLCYLNSISVVPGASISVIVGAAGGAGTAGGASSFNGTLIAAGGSGTTTATGAAGGGGSGGTCFTGGAGGSFVGGGAPYHAGAGGAAGYTGNGGRGGDASGSSCPVNSAAGAGGGGGGGGAGNDPANCGFGYGGGGGGVGVLGVGTSGAAGVSACACGGQGAPGGAGSSGTAGLAGAGGRYGGGGGSENAGQGAVRVMWGGGRTFPSGGATLLYHGYADPGLAGCVITSYNATAATNLGGSYPYNAGDSIICRAWKLAATVCTTAPVGYGYVPPGNWSCPNSGGFTDPTFGTYCAVANQYSCSDCYGACNAVCAYNPLSLRNCAGSEASQP